MAEINEKIPPPIQFEVLFSNDYGWDCSHFFGFSLASGEKVMKDNNYTILCIYDVNNILCIDNKYLEKLGIIPREISNIYSEDYINNSERMKFYWNNNVNYWFEIKDTNKLKEEIINFFSNKSQGKDFIIN